MGYTDAIRWNLINVTPNSENRAELIDEFEFLENLLERLSTQCTVQAEVIVQQRRKLRRTAQRLHNFMIETAKAQRPTSEYFHVGGYIKDEQGFVVYNIDELEDLSDDARDRLATLCALGLHLVTLREMLTDEGYST